MIMDDKKRVVATLGADIEGNKADAEWTYHWDGIPLKEKPKFKFEARGNRCKKVESGEVEIGMEIHKVLTYEDGEPMDDKKYTILFENGDSINGTTDKDGKIDSENLVPGKFDIVINGDEDEWK